MAAERYILKHFYYGQFVNQGKAGGDLRLLAKTHGLSDDAIAEALKVGLVPPMPGTSEGSWALVRGRKEVPFVLVEGELGSAGQPMLHFIVLPSELVRALGGNFRQLKPLIEGEMPTYSKVGNTLKPLILSEISPPTVDQEIDDILELMDYTGNRMNIMETLLAAVVRGVPLVVRNAPDDPDQHVTFIIGLLALLPPSVRFAVSFATYTKASTKLDVQVRFLAGDAPDPEGALVFDWKTRELRGEQPQDDYSRFVVSQLRLDPSLVIQQTRRLTAIANWRVKQGDRLAAALAYASNRVSMDDAVTTNQPVEADDVARVLANDPTLDDDMRLAYARHLMSFSLALGELEHAEPLGMMLRMNADLEKAAYSRLVEAVNKGDAGDVYDLLEKWLVNPLGPQSRQWIDLCHRAAEIYFNDIIDDGDTDEVRLFIEDVDRAGGAVRADTLMPKLIDIALPLIMLDRELAVSTFSIAAKHMSRDELYQMLQQPDYLAHMPKALQACVSAFNSRTPAPQDRLLVKAAKGFERERVLITLRLAEMALHHNHLEMIDDAVLKVLVSAVRAGYGVQYEGLLQDVVNAFSEPDALKQLGEPGNRFLLGTLLARGEYDQLARRMIEQARLLYPGDLQDGYPVMVHRLFAETPIPEENVPNVLSALETNGIKSLPLAMAFVGVLESQKPSVVTDAVAGDATEMIGSNPTVVSMVPMDAVSTLLQYHMRKQDVESTLAVLAYLPDVAARYGLKTARMMGSVYKRLDWDPRLKTVAIDMLRRYIRLLSQDDAERATAALGKGLGRQVHERLKATVAVKSLMDSHDIVTYASFLHDVAEFLHDTAEAYINGRSVPSQGALLNDLDSMPGNLSAEEKQRISADVLQAGLAIAELGRAHAKLRNADNERFIEQLLKAETDPRSALEVLRVMGGYLSQGKRYQMNLKAQQYPHPLPKRSCGSLLLEVEHVRYLLVGTVEAMPDTEKKPTLKAWAIHEEVDSLWRTVPLATQREIIGDLARDLQRVAELVPAIATSGDIRALQDTSMGRRLAENKARPRSTLEFYRFVAGYYLMHV